MSDTLPPDPTLARRDFLVDLASLLAIGQAGLPGAPRDDPESVYQETVRAFEAGAHGVVASREYEEMRLDNLRAFGPRATC